MAKVRKSALKVVKKKWVPIYATAEFNKIKIGETYVVETKDAVNKPLKVNLMTLTMDPKKQNISVSFVTDRIEGDGVHTHVVGYQMSPVSLKKIVTVYPDGKTFTNVSMDDVDIIINEFLQ